jgi:hypothetical protein
MHDARPQSTGDEGKMGVGIARFDGTLRRVEIAAAFQAVVCVTGTLRKERAEGIDVAGDAMGA